MTRNTLNHLKSGLFVGILVLPLAFGACAKSKKDPNVGYDSQSGSSSTGGSEGGNIGESDLGDGKGGVRGGGTATIEGMQTVYFDYDSSALTSGARSTIEANTNVLKSNAKMKVTIEGHCDDRGSTEYNLALGERRANSVRDYVANLGVAKSRMKTISYGEERPAVKGTGEEVWAKNRRAVFTKNN